MEVNALIVARAPNYPVQFMLSSGLHPKQGHSQTVPYPILTMRFLYQDVQYPKGFLSGLSAMLGYPLPRWDIVVNAILRRSRNSIRQEIFDKGFDELYDWLIAAREPIWFQQNHSLTILYHEDRKRLHYSYYDGNDR